MIEFKEFPKIARISRDCVITEKIDGTNASIFIEQNRALNPCPEKDDAWPGFYLVDDLVIGAASRTKWISRQADNAGFAKWVYEHRAELAAVLGPGHHFGEWWGGNIQRGYGIKEKRFSLFNTSRWTNDNRPACCHVVPILYQGPFLTSAVDECIEKLLKEGSVAAPGFMKPEGVVVYHTAQGNMFKKTVEKDEQHKSEYRDAI